MAGCGGGAGARRNVLTATLLLAATAVHARTSSVFLAPPGMPAGAGFGAALDGDDATLVVGAPGAGTGGTVYVFTRSADAWTPAATIVPADAQAGDEFGAAVALAGDTLVVGAPGRDQAGAADVGAAYVFSGAADAWAERATLVPGGAGAGWRAGTAVDLGGDLLVLGAPGAASDTGTAAAFAGGGAAWQALPPVLDATTLQPGDLAGTGVATDGATVVVGAPGRDGGAKLPDAGAAWVVARSGAAFAAATLVEPAPSQHDRFGFAVDVRGDDLAVGVPSGEYSDGNSTVAVRDP